MHRMRLTAKEASVDEPIKWRPHEEFLNRTLTRATE